jgi:glycosyltransferase involved in cell wall biosynthesis
MHRGSIVIPAHNEAAVIVDCLTALYSDPRVRQLDVIVSCNGCTDGTADVVRGLRLPVQVTEIDQASKPAAIRCAEAITTALPRLYVDADVVLPGAAAIAVLDRLRGGGPLAARPPAVYDTSKSNALVRRFYRARSAAAGLATMLCGAGVYALAAAGRARFGDFPDVVADDLFVDRLFGRDEIEITACEPVVVRAPRTLFDLLRILRRNYRSKAEDQGFAVAPEPAWRTLAAVLAYGRHGPRQSLDAAAYVGIAVTARVARRTIGRQRWERDSSPRPANRR